MCGRYSLAADIRTLRERFGFSAPDRPPAPRYNIAPGQEAPVVVAEEDIRRLAVMRWGLVPSCAADASIGGRMINARAETAARKAAFRGPFERRRCLVPADGFYEWDRRTRAPSRFVLKDRRLFSFAGLWDAWRDPADGRELRTFAILTTEADEPVRRVHTRMPVILWAEDEAPWLDPGTPKPSLLRLLSFRASSQLEGCRVSRRVNSSKVDDPGLIEPAQEAQPELGL